VTDDAVLADPAFLPAAQAVLAVCGRAAALHLRGHASSAALLYALGTHLCELGLRTGGWLMVNDRVDVAMAVRANGVQLGMRSMPVADARALLGAGARIGCSVHAPLEAAQARTDGADLVLAGTIYGSPTHPGRPPAGPRLVEECAARSGLPVVAIGGVTPERVAELARAGAHGVAVLGAVWHADDPAGAARRLVEALRQAYADSGEEQES
jgi:thiamine-phosphate diphosphorylase